MLSISIAALPSHRCGLLVPSHDQGERESSNRMSRLSRHRFRPFPKDPAAGEARLGQDTPGGRNPAQCRTSGGERAMISIEISGHGQYTILQLGKKDSARYGLGRHGASGWPLAPARERLGSRSLRPGTMN